MMNRMTFSHSYQNMNLIFRTQAGTELWLGDYYAATDPKLLKKRHIRHVLTAAAMLNVAYPKDMQIRHKTLHAFDCPSYKMTPHFQQAHQFIRDGLNTGNVLVHCAAGISRSTTCVLVYLMKDKHMRFKDALQLARSQRSIVNPNHGFQSELTKLDLYLMKKGHYQKKTQVQQPSSYKNQPPTFQDSKVDNPLSRYTREYQKKLIKHRWRSLAPQTKTNIQVKRNQQRSRNKPQDRIYSLLKRKTQSKGGGKQVTLDPVNNFLIFKIQVPKIVTVKK